ncbi:SH3 domain-containing protein [Rhodanobacter sp. FDAARGOS 1247]|uniref:SH3 domain-containing protein n=1 Tax=Rhodanobacter sp. FDAARGOS 1247 TaxID=2778082 RepID=UPI00194F5D70|nr:SH3 domain-containing protein [Rhodanobacter sp. FDAARGOS 1247]QRP62781.1 SH3 domain-containing protein [Rhodanobacter sp. FDAARGOS 1247]
MKRLARFALASLSLASLSLAVPALAHAEDGYVTGNVNLRAGPDPGYPLIDVIPAGTEVNVQGCTEGWEWCDVIVYGNRGWVAGNYVEYEYRDGPVLLPAYGARIGIPIITFVIGTYWDNYYRSRPFYRERDHWYHRRIVHRPPPPPMRHPYRPPVHGAPGYGRPPIHRPPAAARPVLPRPGQSPHPSGDHRPAQDNAPRPTRPPVSRPPQHATPRPTPSGRPVQSSRPAPQNRAPTQHSTQAAGHASPARSDHGKPKQKQSDHRKDEHPGH